MTTVVRQGLIFKLGDYPDKRFSLDANEARRAVELFQPVPIDSEHKDSVFDGKMGKLQTVELRGDAVHGTLEIAQWLHDLFPNEPIPLSATWSRETPKRITGLALAKHPRVSEAAMMAAFSASRHDTFDGQDIHQAMHDMAARHGAICNDPAAMVSRHESSGLQIIHDTTLQHGAKCSSMGTMAFSDELALFVAKRNSASDQKNLDAAHEAIVKAGATCAGTATMHKEHSMKVFDKEWWSNMLGGAQDAGLVVAEFQADSKPTTTTPQGDSAEVARLKAELAKANAARITSDAAHFADAQIAAHKALPAERESIIAAFTQAAQDDGQHGAVTFANGKTSSRVEQLTALFAARPAHTLTKELIITQDGKEGVGFAGNKLEQPRTGDEDQALIDEADKSARKYAERANGKK